MRLTFTAMLLLFPFASFQGLAIVADDGLPNSIAFHGVLEDGLKEAETSNRPIFLLSAAPQCAGVPGMW